MRKKAYIILLLVFCVSIIHSCKIGDADNEYRFIYLTNKSDETIYVEEFLCYGSKVLSPYIVFDLHEGYLLHEIQCGEKLGNSLIFDETNENLQKIYQLIVFKQSTLTKYTNEELIENNIYDKLYSFTYEELKAMNFEIIYTGD